MGAIWLDNHTLYVEKKLLLFRLSIERSLGSEEGDGDQLHMYRGLMMELHSRGNPCL